MVSWCTWVALPPPRRRRSASRDRRRGGRRRREAAPSAVSQGKLSAVLSGATLKLRLQLGRGCQARGRRARQAARAARGGTQEDGRCQGYCAERRRARGIIGELHAGGLLSARTGPPFERTRLCQRDRLCLRAHACARGSGSGARQCRPALCGRGAEGQGSEAGRGSSRGVHQQAEQARIAEMGLASERVRRCCCSGVAARCTVPPIAFVKEGRRARSRAYAPCRPVPGAHMIRHEVEVVVIKMLLVALACRLSCVVLFSHK